MRRVRWKSKYDTGDRRLDEHHKALVAALLHVDSLLRSKEHCQDMEDLYRELTDMAGERLRDRRSFRQGRGSDKAFQGLLTDGLPLAALDTPACRDCGICDLTGERIRAWLDEGAALAQPSVVPDAAEGHTASASH